MSPLVRRGALCALAAGAGACGRLDFEARDGGAAPPVIDADSNAPPDQDGDDVADGDDNCPAIGNPDQADEDGDLRGDVCDPCPIAVDDTDQDGDGVGDACDPRPTLPGETIAFFDGFAAFEPSAWETFGDGAWSQVVPGEVAYDSVSFEPGALVIPVDLAPPLHAMTSVELHTLEQTNTTLSLIDGVDVVAMDGEKCGVGALHTASPTLATGDFVANASVAENQTAWPGSTALGTVYALRLDHRDGILACRGSDGAAMTSVQQPAMRTSGRLGVRLRGLDASVRYLLVIATS